MKNQQFLFIVLTIGMLTACGQQVNEPKEQPTTVPTMSTEVPKATATATVEAVSNVTKLDVGFYTTDKVELKSKLKSYPHQYASIEEAHAAGVLMDSYHMAAKDKKKNDALWMDFVRCTETAKKQGKDYRQALIGLNYTTEGDPIYTYVLYENGTYYVLMDSSRDRFGSMEDYMEYKNAKLTKEAGEGKSVIYQVGKGESGFFYSTGE